LSKDFRRKKAIITRFKTYLELVSKDTSKIPVDNKRTKKAESFQRFS